MSHATPRVEEDLVELEAFVVDWVPVLVKAGLAPSRSAAHRLIEACALRVDGLVESRYTSEVARKNEDPVFVVQVYNTTKIVRFNPSKESGNRFNLVSGRREYGLPWYTSDETSR
jgi:tyrosyl-tRNA synthetase